MFKVWKRDALCFGLLKYVDTANAQRVRPTIGKTLPVWEKKRLRWPAKSWGQDAACGSSSGGGSAGYVASYDALKDIYDFVQ